MINFYDIAYSLGLGVASPFWLLKPGARRKVLKAFQERMGRVEHRPGSARAILIHAVSLGEINATPGIVRQLNAQRSDLHIIISTTTETGYARAVELYGGRESAPSPITVIRYPLDFTPAVERVLDHLRPDVVVLMELEIWPNFLRACARRVIPVIVANGRVSTTSFKKYLLAGPLVRKMFTRLSAACVQDQLYAQRFAKLGVAPEKICIAGTMKFDTATIGARVEGDEAIAHSVGVTPASWNPSDFHAERVWVCGSTGPGEEQLILQQYRSLLTRHARLRLVIVPRKPERFDEVAQLIVDAGFELVRRSQRKASVSASAQQVAAAGHPAPSAQHSLIPPVVLGDTIGELRRFYSMADVVFVGRTLVDLGAKQHGSDMIEPSALGKAVIVGPYTGNFVEVMARFREAESMMEVSDVQQLGEAVSVLLSTPDAAREMGQKAQGVVERERGATERHVKLILQQLDQRLTAPQA